MVQWEKEAFTAYCTMQLMRLGFDKVVNFTNSFPFSSSRELGQAGQCKKQHMPSKQQGIFSLFGWQGPRSIMYAEVGGTGQRGAREDPKLVIN